MRGLALLMVVGILTALALSAAAMLSLGTVLRERGSGALDAAQARLLARSGIEYARARLGENPEPAKPATVENQPDDWTCRDSSEVPLEKILNPSYAHAEPYSDLQTNGAYDLGSEPYTDLDGNNRFDSWSGRLRGRFGQSSGTFALRISAGDTEGGICVNSGFLYAGDLNGNKIPDCRDLGEPDNLATQTWRQYTGSYTGGSRLPAPVAGVPGWNLKEHPARNRRVAFAINELGALLGLAAPRPGDDIVAHRPLGGYRDPEELASLFPVPGDWEKLRPCLGTAGRRNPYARYPFNANIGGTPAGPATAPVALGDIQNLLNLDAASPETLAALFSMRGISTNILYPPPEDHYIDRAEALRTARFLKQVPFASWYDLFVRLQENAGSLFKSSDFAIPYANSALDVDPTGRTMQGFKAAWAHALAYPNDTPAWAFTSIAFWPSRFCKVYDGPPQTLSLTLHNYGTPPFAWDSHQFLGQSGAIGTGPVSLFSIRSLGRVAGRGPRAFWAERSLFRGAGWAQACSQDDFENLNFDMASRSFRPSRRFEGGAVEGRPSRDRATSYPLFSRDACPDLASDPLLDYGANVVYKPVREALGEWAVDFNYPRFGGSIGLLDRSWLDPDAVFYLPFWDLDQPERPKTGEVSSTDLNFDDWNIHDPAHRARWIRGGPYLLFYAWTRRVPVDLCAIRGGLFLSWKGYYGCEIDETTAVHAGDMPLSGGGLVYKWGNGAGAYGKTETNAWEFPLAYRGAVLDGTIEGWGLCFGIDETPVPGSPRSHLPLRSYDPRQWEQGDGNHPKYHYMYDPSQPSREDLSLHVAFAFRDEEEYVRMYVDGIYRNGIDFEPFSLDPTRSHLLTTYTDEFRLYRIALSEKQLQAQSLAGRFWTPDPVGGIPSFTSPLYHFDNAVRLTRAGWDGFVPRPIRDALGGLEEPAPIRVELLLYGLGSSGGESPLVLPFPVEAWKTGGCRRDFKALWETAFPGQPVPAIRALKYRVFLDASALDVAWETPRFDGVELSFKAGK